MKTFKNYPLVLTLGLAVTVLGAVVIVATQNSDDLGFAQNAPGDILSIMSKSYTMENPNLAINKNGDIVIVWQERKNMDYEVFAMKGKLDNLTGFSQPVQANKYKLGNQSGPSVAMSDTGESVVVWESANQDRSCSGVYGQRFTASMKKNGPEIQVHKTTVDCQASPDVAMSDTGAFTVVWTSETGDNKTKHIYMQLFDNKGKKIGSETKGDKGALNAASTMNNPKIAMHGTGEMIVVWENVKSAGLIDVGAQVFDPAGAPKTNTDIALNATSEDKNFNPNVIGFGADQYLVTWEKDLKAKEFKNLELLFENIRGRIVKADGTLGNEVDYSPAKNINSNNNPELSATGNGAVVVWQERKNVGEKTGSKNQWFMQAREIDSEGKPVGEVIPLINGRGTPYSGTGVGSNGNELVGILWSEKENGTSKSKIQFRPWTLQITAKETEEVHTAAPEEGATPGN